MDLDISSTLEAVEHLAVIQTRTTEQMLIPDLTRTLLREVAAWANAAALIESVEVIRRWDRFQFRVPTGASNQLREVGESGFSVSFYEPLSVQVEGRDVDLGLQRLVLETVVVDVVESPTDGADELVKVIPGSSHDVHFVLLDAAEAASLRESGEERRVRWRPPQPPTQLDV